MRLSSFLLLFTMLAGVNSFAGVLGLGDGVYRGQGALISQKPLVPNLKFDSVRQIIGDSILVQTKASKFGIVLAEASANLKVITINVERFELWDMNLGRKAGEGQCGPGYCSFEVGVMPDSSGVPQLTLKETWVPDEEGFRVLQGSQVFKGKPAKYDGVFKLINY